MRTGCRELNHLTENIKKHHECALHLENVCKYKMFITISNTTPIDSQSEFQLKNMDKLQKTGIQ